MPTVKYTVSKWGGGDPPLVLISLCAADLLPGYLHDPFKPH